MELNLNWHVLAPSASSQSQHCGGARSSCGVDAQKQYCIWCWIWGRLLSYQGQHTRDFRLTPKTHRGWGILCKKRIASWSLFKVRQWQKAGWSGEGRVLPNSQGKPEMVGCGCHADYGCWGQAGTALAIARDITERKAAKKSVTLVSRSSWCVAGFGRLSRASESCLVKTLAFTTEWNPIPYRLFILKTALRMIAEVQKLAAEKPLVLRTLQTALTGFCGILSDSENRNYSYCVAHVTSLSCKQAEEELREISVALETLWRTSRLDYRAGRYITVNRAYASNLVIARRWLDVECS